MKVVVCVLQASILSYRLDSLARLFLQHHTDWSEKRLWCIMGGIVWPGNPAYRREWRFKACKLQLLQWYLRQVQFNVKLIQSEVFGSIQQTEIFLFRLCQPEMKYFVYDFSEWKIKSWQH